MPGDARRSQRVEWVKYDLLHSYWNRAVGGKDAAADYRRYVNEGLMNPEDPFKQQLREWVFGSEDFLRWMIALAEGKDRHRHESTIRRVRAVTVMELHEATALHHGIDRLQYAAFRSAAPGRDMAAWLCRRWTGATLRELGPAFGLTGTDSVSNLVRLTGQQFKVSASWRKRASEIAATLHLKTEHKT
jgi:hypothetical protein